MTYCLAVTNHPFILPLDLSLPFSELFTPFADGSTSYFFDSTLMGGRTHRYSHFGINPVATFESREGFVTTNGHTVIDSPVDALKNFLKPLLSIPADRYSPFVYTVAGYLGYEWAIEHMHPHKPEDHATIPDCWFAIFDTIVVHDIPENSAWIISIGLDDTLKPDINLAKQRAHHLKESLFAQHHAPDTKAPSPFSLRSPIGFTDLQSLIGQYCDRMKTDQSVKVNFSQRFQSIVADSAWKIHHRLRSALASPYSAYLNCGPFQISSISSKCALQVEADTVITQPVVHHQTLNPSPLEQETQMENLLNQTPIELRQISGDLRPLWNLCDIDSIEWGIPSIEREKNSICTTASISAKKKGTTDVIDLLAAFIPSSTMIGHPKKEARRIINELEPVRRNIYTGCIGYITAGEKAQFTLATRTLCVKDSMAYIHSGSWISNLHELPKALNPSTRHIESRLNYGLPEELTEKLPEKLTVEPPDE